MEYGSKYKDKRETGEEERYKKSVTSIWRVTGTSRRLKRLSEENTPAHILFVFYSVCNSKRFSDEDILSILSEVSTQHILLLLKKKKINLKFDSFTILHTECQVATQYSTKTVFIFVQCNLSMLAPA